MNPVPYLPIEWQQVSLRLDGIDRLTDINCTLSNGGITAIMGHNGSGKTLLLKLCAGLLSPTQGQIIWQQAIEPPQISYVPTHGVMLNHTVEKNILKPLEYHKVPNSTECCDEALKWANIEHLRHQSALALSTGEQQLVAVARAWALKPGVLLLDEPSANLDPGRQQSINQLIKQLSIECKIILSSHSVRQARELASDVILLKNGKLSTHLEADAFFDSAEFHLFSGINPAPKLCD